MYKRPMWAWINMRADDKAPPAWFTLPSQSASNPIPAPSPLIHDLDVLFPSPPIPLDSNEIVVRRARLNDPTFLNPILNWIADGDVVVIEMRDVMRRTVELDATISRLQKFIVGDLGGQVLQLDADRLLLLPPGVDVDQVGESIEN